jgi:hypothetical protein
MNKLFLMIFTTLIGMLLSVQITLAQDTIHQIKKQEPIKKIDNYTVQYLVILNNKSEMLLQKNEAGWHTPVIRSNKNQSITEAMDSLAGSVGLRIHSLKLSGLYTYKFEGLPDHPESSFRMHFTARLKDGQLIQPTDPGRSYQWVPVKEAIQKLTFESLKLETSQILTYPEKVWGGTFLITWKDDQFIGSKVIEKLYPLN